MADVLRHIVEQVEAAGPELEVYPPQAIDWPARCRVAVARLVPWLIETAEEVKREIDSCLASPAYVRETWGRVKAQGRVPPALASEMDHHLEREEVLLAAPSGALISKLIEQHLIACCALQDVRSNGASDYPDLYLSSLDYSQLPSHSRSASEFGAALKGGRPVRVPDGVEIKTVRVGAGIDCHFPHVGLHYILQYDARRTPMSVTDIRIGFIRKETYRISGRRTEATTVKASLGRSVIDSEAFVSILTPSQQLW